MAPVLRSLSDFKRFLAEPGATIQVVRNTYVARQPTSYGEAYRAKGLYEPRSVRALSKKAAVFSIQGHANTVWLYWDKGTRNWRFDADTVAIPLDTGLGPPDEIVYRCSYAPDPATGPSDGVEPARIPATTAEAPADAPAPDAPAAIRPVMPAEGQGCLL